MTDLDKRIMLAELCKRTVKESTLPDLQGVLLCGSGFHLIWNPYKDSDQAFHVMLCLYAQLNMVRDSNTVCVNGTDYFIDEFKDVASAVRHAICEEAVKYIKEKRLRA